MPTRIPRDKKNAPQSLNHKPLVINTLRIESKKRAKKIKKNVIFLLQKFAGMFFWLTFASQNQTVVQFLKTLGV